MRIKKTQPASRQEEVFKALGDASRLQILQLLLVEEMNAMQILEKVSLAQSTLSHHMTVLCEAGILHARRHGKSTIYSIRKDTITEMMGWGETFLRMMTGEVIPESVIEEPVSQKYVSEDIMDTEAELHIEENLELADSLGMADDLEPAGNTEPANDLDPAGTLDLQPESGQDNKESKKPKKDKKQKKKKSKDKDKKKEKDKTKKKKDKK